jgi:hypothetical protein
VRRPRGDQVSGTAAWSRRVGIQRAANDERRLCGWGVAGLQRLLNRAALLNWIDGEVRHVLFNFVISGGRHQVSSISLRVKTKHNIHFLPTLDRDALTYSGSLRK